MVLSAALFSCKAPQNFLVKHGIKCSTKDCDNWILYFIISIAFV